MYLVFLSLYENVGATGERLSHTGADTADIMIACIAQVAGFPQRRPRFATGSGQPRTVLDKVVLGQVFSEYFGFPYQSSFHHILHLHNHHEQVK
jgi:hypothetical protein